MYLIAVRHMSPYRLFFFFNDTATTEIYTLSLHDALPILGTAAHRFGELPALFVADVARRRADQARHRVLLHVLAHRSEEHTSELQSHVNLVCRLLLEKKKNRISSGSRQ